MFGLNQEDQNGNREFWICMFTEDEMKYEYMLHTWGGFYNKEYRDVHGYAPGYYWFETADERKSYVETLKFIEESAE